MTPLRQRFIDDMGFRNYSPETINSFGIALEDLGHRLLEDLLIFAGGARGPFVPGERR